MALKRKGFEKALIEDVSSVATRIGLDLIGEDILITVERPPQYGKAPRDKAAVGKLLSVRTDYTNLGEPDNTVRFHFEGGMEFAVFRNDTLEIQTVARA